MSPLIGIIFYILLLFGLVMVISFVISIFVTFIGIWMVDRASKRNAKEILPMLPGTDCKECECESCAHYAQWSADERKELGKCPYLSQETISAINGLFPMAEPYKKRTLRDTAGRWFRRNQ
ncbi:MAG: hypothetical protein IKW10_03895 [Oscillospiraceae bacterium]|nr:hypothetical protein [Oscillospiraceae bacterium]